MNEIKEKYEVGIPYLPSQYISAVESLILTIAPNGYVYDLEVRDMLIKQVNDLCQGYIDSLLNASKNAIRHILHKKHNHPRMINADEIKLIGVCTRGCWGVKISINRRLDMRSLGHYGGYNPDNYWKNPRHSPQYRGYVQTKEEHTISLPISPETIKLYIIYLRVL